MELTVAEAICRAQRDAMAEDDRVILLGQDIAAGFPFGATKGLVDEFGTDRVRNTPISEAAAMGCAVGAAMAGLRPVLEIDFAGFGLLGLDQLVNNAAKLRYMSGGQLRVPLVVRMGQGPLGAFAAQHTQSLHGWLANVPGLAVYAPATAQDAYSLVRRAMEVDDPVVVAEDLRLYRHRGPVAVAADHRGAARAVTVRDGVDVSVVAYGYGVHIALQAAERLASEGISVEVLNLRVLMPLDAEAIGESVRRTGRAVCIGDDAAAFGVAGSLAAVVQSEAHGELRAPVAQLSSRHVPAPFSPRLEDLVFPTGDSVAAAVHEVMAWETSNA